MPQSNTPSKIILPENPPTTTSPVSQKFPLSSSPTGSRVQSQRNGSGGSSHSRPKHDKERSLDTHYDGPVIPPSTKERKRRRTVVLCFDGTGDQFDNDNSNVVNFFALLKKGEPRQQLVYYQAIFYVIPHNVQFSLVYSYLGRHRDIHGSTNRFPFRVTNLEDNRHDDRLKSPPPCHGWVRILNGKL
jgi:sRNA-binding regulator protein Hfq